MSGCLKSPGLALEVGQPNCLRLVSVSYELSIWYADSCKKIGTTRQQAKNSHEFRTPKLTSMLGVYAMHSSRVGQSTLLN